MTAPIDVYARVSRLGDKDKTTTTSQVAVCCAVLDERGLPAGETFVDDGKSAWNPKVVRDGWQAVMGRIESGTSGGVIVYDLERFARQLSDGERLVAAADRGFLILDSESVYDLRNPGDKKNFRNAIIAAEYYSDLLGQRTRRGKRAKALRGEVDERRSFGFESDGITVKEAEAAIIRDWARRLLDGESQQALIDEANARGIESVRGAPWGYTTFRQIMMRPRNIGLITYNGEVVQGARLPGKQILGDGTYARLVAQYSARKPGRPPSGRYLLTGMADCPCGSALSGRHVYGTTRNQYWCRTCHHTFVEMVRLDEWAADWTVKTLADPGHAEALAAADEIKSKRSRELVAERGSIERIMTEIAGRLGRQEMSLARHDAICGPLEARLVAIAAELESLASQAIPVPKGQRTIPRDDARYIAVLDDWDSGTPAAKRAMVTRALAGRRIVVGPGRDAKFDPDRVSVA